jgi:hypothetical protein
MAMQRKEKIREGAAEAAEVEGGGATGPGAAPVTLGLFLLPGGRPGRRLAGAVMTHKYRGCIVVLSINKSVEPNEEQKVLMSSFDQGITVNNSKQVFRSIW